MIIFTRCQKLSLTLHCYVPINTHPMIDLANHILLHATHRVYEDS